MEISILDDGQTLSAADGSVRTTEDGRMLMRQSELQGSLGWTLKPEGLCQADTCVPVRDRSQLLPADGNDEIDLSAFAAALGRPCVIDIDAEQKAGVFALGTAANAQAASMATLEAPDFELPDIHGQMHTLSEHRGKKVLLIAYASW